MSYPLFDKDEHWHKPEQAFLTDDHRTILRFAVEALMSGKGAVLVTLVEIRGGAARPLGAQMVVREDGRYCGFVSGGCVEAAAAFEALEMMGSGRDREIRYGEGSPWFDIVLPCGGGITLTLHKLRSAQPLLAVLNRTEQRKPAGLRYDPQAQSLVCLPTQTRTGWNLNGFEVGFRPCVRLMIYGRSLEAQATASLAAATGYDSHIFDLFRPQPALRSIPIRRSFCCAMISTGSCQCCRPREKQNPFISAHWAAIEPTLYVCKSSTSWDGPGGDSANPGTRRDISQSPGCAYSGTLRAGRSRLCTSPSGGGFMPAPSS